jgi:geranylgeranylglycerol-phosphate geranylgeranyltransferase
MSTTPILPSSPRSIAAALVALMRPVNAVVAFTGVAAACVIAGADAGDWPHILFAACGGMLAASAGNVINDVYDVEIDRVNKPWRALAAGRLRPATATTWAALLGCAALAFTIPLGSAPLLIMGASLIAMFLYSAWLKRIPLLGNLLVAVLTGIAFLYGAAAFGDVSAGLLPAGFALLFNLAREVLKDVEDMRGDRAGAVVTWPLRAGETAALRLVSAVLLLLIAATLVPMLLGIYGPAYGYVVVFGVDSVLLHVLIAMWKDRSTDNIRRLNVLLKYDMIAGIAAILLGSITA